MTCHVALLGADRTAVAGLARAIESRLAQPATVHLPTDVDPTALLRLARECGLVMLASCDGSAIDEATELTLRATLAQAGLSYSVLHGTLAHRVENACHLIGALQGVAPPVTRSGANTAWKWRCDKCSDPACEHRLFVDLIAARSRDDG